MGLDISKILVKSEFWLVSLSFCLQLNSEDTSFIEAVEQFLEGWASILEHSAQLPAGVFNDSATKILNCYVQCHLAAPEGLRGTFSSQVNNGIHLDEICDLDSDDRELFADQLCTVGSFGRIVPGHALTILTKLLESRVDQFEKYLAAVKNTRGMGAVAMLSLSRLTIIRRMYTIRAVSKSCPWVLWCPMGVDRDDMWFQGQDAILVWLAQLVSISCHHCPAAQAHSQKSCHHTPVSVGMVMSEIPCGFNLAPRAHKPFGQWRPHALDLWDNQKWEVKFWLPVSRAHVQKFMKSILLK